MKNGILENFEEHHKSISSFLFDKPLRKALMLVVLQAIVFLIGSQFPNHFSIRALAISLNILITIYFALLFFHILRRSLAHLMHPRNFGVLVIAYLFLVFAVIIIFATAYDLVEVGGLGYLKYGSCNGNFDPGMVFSDPDLSREFFYFSAITFFTVGYGDICPMGLAKYVSILAAFSGHLISVMLVALIINNYFQHRRKDAKTLHKEDEELNREKWF